MQELAFSSLPLALWLPALILGTTCFLRVTILLSALRAGLGAERLLPGSVMATLGFLVTALVMYPTLQQMGVAASAALGSSEGLNAIDPLRTWASAERLQPILAPLWAFMRMQAQGNELTFFGDLQGLALDHPMVVVPAFLLSELTSALKGAVVILLPFWLLDLLGAQAMSMLGWTLPPAYLTLPIKLLFFQAIDGWHLIVGALYQSYH